MEEKKHIEPIANYTVITVNNTGINFKSKEYGIVDINMAKAIAAAFAIDEDIDSVMLIDNSTNKGIHFDPSDYNEDLFNRFTQSFSCNCKNHTISAGAGYVEVDVLLDGRKWNDVFPYAPIETEHYKTFICKPEDIADPMYYAFKVREELDNHKSNYVRDIIKRNEGNIEIIAKSQVEYINYDEEDLHTFKLKY